MTLRREARSATNCQRRLMLRDQFANGFLPSPHLVGCCGAEQPRRKR
jgi:hypothetical protein